MVFEREIPWIHINPDNFRIKKFAAPNILALSNFLSALWTNRLSVVSLRRLDLAFSAAILNGKMDFKSRRMLCFSLRWGNSQFVLFLKQYKCLCLVDFCLFKLCAEFDINRTGIGFLELFLRL